MVPRHHETHRQPKGSEQSNCCTRVHPKLTTLTLPHDLSIHEAQTVKAVLIHQNRFNWGRPNVQAKPTHKNMNNKGGSADAQWPANACKLRGRRTFDQRLAEFRNISPSATT